MQDNTETHPDIILARARLGRAQATLNIELGLANRASIPSGGSTSSQVGGGGISSSNTIIGEAGGGTGSSGSDGGGPLCFAGNTMIRMADSNERRPIYAIPSGLDVAAPDEHGVLQPGRVLGKTEKFFTEFFRVTFADKRHVELRPKHRYRNENGMYVPIREADHVIHWTGSDWQKVRITQKTWVKIRSPRLFYNFEIELYGAYLANDDWVSNRKIELE